MALVMNDSLRNAINSRFVYAGVPGTTSNQWIVKLFSTAMPATASLPTSSTYITGQVWQSSASSNKITLQVVGDLFSISSGDSTFNATAAGTVQWAMIYSASALNNLLFTDSIGLTGTNAVVQLSSLTAVSGTPLSLYALNFRILGN